MDEVDVAEVTPAAKSQSAKAQSGKGSKTPRGKGGKSAAAAEDKTNQVQKSTPQPEKPTSIIKTPGKQKDGKHANKSAAQEAPQTSTPG